jgi:hypothetical protein
MPFPAIRNIVYCDRGMVKWPNQIVCIRSPNGPEQKENTR